MQCPEKVNNFVNPHPPTFHPQNWTIDLLFRNNRICKHVTNSKAFNPLPYGFHLCTAIMLFLSFVSMFLNNFLQLFEDFLQLLLYLVTLKLCRCDCFSHCLNFSKNKGGKVIIHILIAVKNLHCHIWYIWYYMF